MSTDAATGDHLADLIAAEARWQCSAVNAVPTGVVRHLVARLLHDASPSRRGEVAAMTDDELWGLLLTDPTTADAARSLRRDPAGWRAVDASTAAASEPGRIPYTVTRLSLGVPLVDGAPLSRDHAAFAHLPALPWERTILAPLSNDDRASH